MSYIQQVLQPGETVRYQGSTHWMLYFPAILLAAVALVSLISTWGAPQPYGLLIAIACLTIAFVLAVRAWWIRWNTEIAVTDRRTSLAIPVRPRASELGGWLRSEARLR